MDMNKMKVNTCPVCNSTDLKWGDGGLSEGTCEYYIYNFTCNQCGSECKEYHELVYIKTLVEV